MIDGEIVWKWGEGGKVRESGGQESPSGVWRQMPDGAKLPKAGPI